MKTENGEQNVKVTVSAAKKRKQDEDDKSSLTIDKKVKIATTCEYFTVQEQRLFELYTDEEENF
jgi:hypothetical protein